MHPKHSVTQLRPARVIFVLAMAVLAGLVGWVAVRAVGPQRDGGRQPTVVLPSMPQVQVGVALTSPAVSVAPFTPPSPPSPAESASPARTSRRSSFSATPSTPTTRVPSKTAKPTTAPPVTLAAALSVTASWDGGYVASVQITNTGTKAVNWTVTVTHASQTGLRLTSTWNAYGTPQSARFVFTGGPLTPGATMNFGYMAATQGAGRPAGCSVVGGACSLR